MQKWKQKKVIIPAAVIVVLLIGLVILNQISSSSKYDYIYQKVEKGSVKKTVSVTGVLQIIDAEVVLSRVQGIINKVYVDYNDKVKKNSLLTTIDVDALDDKISKTTNALNRAKLNLLAAKKEYEGKKKLFKEELVAQRALETAEIKYKTAKYEYQNIYLDYKNLLKSKRNSRIYSPISGVILSKDIDPKARVKVGTKLFVIAPSLSQMKLTVNIDESDIGAIKKGQEVSFSVSAFPDKKFEGSISQVRLNPVKRGGIVTYEAIVTCRNIGNVLKPGMTSTATILVGDKKAILRVPNQAFIVSPEYAKNSKGKKILWLKKGIISGKKPVKPIEVETGLIGDIYTEVKKGLKPGDEVLTKIVEIQD